MVDLAIASRTVIPIFLLAGAGWLARATGVAGPEMPRVLNAYLYWFALPALFTVDLSRARLGLPDLAFLASCVLPLLIAIAAVGVAVSAARLPRRPAVLVAVATIFGSLAFFGIPFVIFAYPGTDTERLATLAAAVASVPAVGASLTLLELTQVAGRGFFAGARTVLGRLAVNPLILSIAVGLSFSSAGLRLPFVVEQPLHMLGTTTATVSFFMLGSALQGRRYAGLGLAAGLAVLRLVLLPLVALAVCALLGLAGTPRDIIVLMHGMPAAVSLLVLSERYDLYPEIVASLILVSSLAAAVTLNVWVVVLASR